MQLQLLISSLAWAAATLAAPTATTTTTNGDGPSTAGVPRRLHGGTRTLPRRGTGAETIAAIMPLSTSCAGRGDECVTAEVAAPYLASGLDHYGVTTAIEQAGILALVAYESVEMQYKRNTNTAAAAGGQGSSNEQSGAFNLEFANSFDELKALGLTTSNVLDYVTNNTYNFWTGPWYYSTYEGCATARSMASSGSTAWEWFNEYISECDGVPLSSEPDRITYWNNALAAFGITNSTTN